MENKKLYLSNDKKLGGVCGGLAEYFDADPSVIRLLYALATIFTAFSGVIVYIILWAVIPSRR